ncbi:alpha-1A adrenergic receptor-like [Clytia hemisphaerica]|uniref:G-protein coupled receptors family 1 profile domain-containing protein n=1 Tax=Clytia hemisphaerica TaxID=252671 RepID=A0A7M5WT85_9CNID|eukprot:TCONS_00021810-protein
MVINTSSSNTTNTGIIPNNEWTFFSLQITGFFTFFVGFPTNLIIIYLVLRRRRLRNPTNYFVCSLAVADVLVLIWLLIWVLGIHNILSTVEVKKFIIPTIDIFLGVASIINVACVSADRGIAVVYPLRYEFILTKRRSVYAILFVWCYAFALLIAAFLRIRYQNETFYAVILYVGFMSYFVPVTIIVVSYSIIFLVIVRKLKSIRDLERVSNAVANQNGEQNDKKKRRRRKLLRELKVTANILLIVLPFTTGWSYFIGTHIYEHAYQTIIKNDAHNIAMIVIPWLLSGLNPIVYLLLNRSLRKAMVETVKKLCHDSASSMEDGSFFSTFSRRASSAIRRASAGFEEGGLLHVPKFLNRRRDSHTSASTPSRSSVDVTKEFNMNAHALYDVEESADKEKNSSVV